MVVRRMIARVLIAFVFSSVLWMSGVRAEEPARDAVDLEALVQRWDQALVSRDHAFVERILADEFTYIGATGEVQTRAELLAQLRDERLRIEEARSDEVMVRLYGDTAVVVARGRTRGHFGSEAFDNAYRFTDVWVRRDSRWQAVLTQITALAAK
jgi:hypothetical protein